MAQSIVYVIDDDKSICRALSLLLKTHGFRVETFNCAQDFMTAKHLKAPSCLILDVMLPGMDGFGLQGMMMTDGLAIPIVFISGHGDIPMSVKAMRAGAVDFLVKPFSSKELLNAIERAIVKSKEQNKTDADVEKIQERIKTLSPRELEVFRFVALGLMNKQIASKRGTSLQTIKVHRSRVMQKMQAKTVTELVHLAHKAGIAIAPTSI